VNKVELQIDYCSHKASKYAVERWHYSKTLPVPPLVKIGVWENSKFIGVVIFSRGASCNLLKPYGLKQTEGCELTRVALNRHKTPVTRIIKIAVLFLKKSSKNLRLIVSFADPKYGHHGGIYQGGNWIYSGCSAKQKEYFKGGRRLHSRQVSEKGWNIQQGAVRRTVKPSECRIVNLEGKHRYLMPLDVEMKKRILPLSKPYPKREKLGDDPDHGNSDGATPILTLHKKVA
jgi:hypothetical protein